MQKANVYIFTSPTCPHCGPAVKFIESFSKRRKDFELHKMSMATALGQKKAAEFEVMAVPTFIIQGPGYPHNIGLKGAQSAKTMNKYLDMSLGKVKRQKKQEKPKKGLRDRLREGIKIGRIRLKF